MHFKFLTQFLLTSAGPQQQPVPEQAAATATASKNLKRLLLSLLAPCTHKYLFLQFINPS